VGHSNNNVNPKGKFILCKRAFEEDRSQNGIRDSVGAVEGSALITKRRKQQNSKRRKKAVLRQGRPKTGAGKVNHRGKAHTNRKGKGEQRKLPQDGEHGGEEVVKLLRS